MRCASFCDAHLFTKFRMSNFRSFLLRCTAVALSGLLMVSCSGRKPKAEPSRAEAFISGLTAADTTEVLTRAQAIVDKIIAGDINGALDGLGQVESDTLYQISSEKIASASKQFQQLNLRQAKLESYTFTDPDHNVVKFRVAFGSTEDESKLLGTAFAVNALKIEGNWYFTLMQ